MKNLKPTLKGKTLSYTTLTLALFTIIFQDPIIFSASTILALTLLTTLAYLTIKARRIGKSSKIIPEKFQKQIVAGRFEETKIIVQNSHKIKFRLKHPINFIRPKKAEHVTNEPIELEISPQLAGEYKANTILFEIESPLKTFTCTQEISYETSITVVPRIMPALIRAIELATATGTLAYEHPIQVVGKGTEYAETREYLPGDDIKHIDWKATARLQKPMIKQFHQETGGIAQIVYDQKAAGPITKDKMATEFLNTATALTSLSIPYTITIVDQTNSLKVKRHKDPKTALYTAIREALATVELDQKYLYDILEPQTRAQIITFLNILLEKTEEEKIETLQVKELDDTDTIAITSLLGDITWITEAYEKLNAKAKNLTLHVPSKTWLDSKTLEEAYEDYQKTLTIQATLKRKGIEIKQIP
ncbi:MAG: DUF58 domain-containing protein [Nitrososphaeria archaeon]|nr:DUF58 domain-containing protein [Nitrososphaeria archaeon]